MITDIELQQGLKPIDNSTDTRDSDQESLNGLLGINVVDKYTRPAPAFQIPTLEAPVRRPKVEELLADMDISKGFSLPVSNNKIQTGTWLDNINSTPYTEKDYLQIQDQANQIEQVSGVSKDEALQRASKIHQLQYGYTSPLTGETSYELPTKKDQVDDLIRQSEQREQQRRERTPTLSESLIASFYDDVENLSKQQKEYISQQVGEQYDNLPNTNKNWAKKILILKDLVDHIDDPSLKQVFNNLPRVSSVENQESVDLLYDHIISKYNRQIFHSKNWWNSIWSGHTMGDATSNVHKRYEAINKSRDNLKDVLEGKSDKSVADIEETLGEHAKRLASNYDTGINADKLQDLLNTVNSNNDARSQKQIQNIRAYIEQLDTPEKDALLTNFIAHSKSIAPSTFKEYYGTDKIDFTREDYLNMIAKYNSDLSLGGQEYADSRLQEAYQRRVADNTNWLEAATNTVIAFGENAALDIGELCAMIGGGAARTIGRGELDWKHFVDNYATQYIDRVLQTGIWFDSEEQQRRLQDGTRAHSTVWTPEQEAAMFGAKTMNEVVAQAGHLAGFSVNAGAASTILSAGAKGITKGSFKVGRAALNLAGKTSKSARGAAAFLESPAGLDAMATALAVSEKTALNLVVPLSTATEATMGAVSVKANMLRQSENALDAQYTSKFYADLQENIVANPNKWAALYRQETNNLVGHFESLPDSSRQQMVYTPKDIQKMMEYFANREGMKESYMQQYQNEIALAKVQAEEAADLGLVTTFIPYMILGSVTNGVFQKSLLPVPVRKTISKWGKGPIRQIDEAIDITMSGGKATATAKDFSKWGSYRDGILEIGSQFVEEYGQSVFDVLGESSAMSALRQMQDAKYANSTSNSALDYDLSESLADGFNNMMGEMTSREAIQSGIIGALSSGLGHLTFKKPNWTKRGEAESWYQTLNRWSPFGWNSPIIDMIEGQSSYIKEESKRRQQIADYVQAYFDDPEHQKLFNTASAMASTMNQLAVAETTGDEKAIRDAKESLLYDAAVYLESLKDTPFYEARVAEIEKRINFQEKNLDDPNSQESIAVAEYMKEKGTDGVSKEQALQEMKSAASKMKQMMEEAAKEVENLQTIFGEDADLEYIIDAAKNSILSKHKQRRLDTLNQEIEQGQKDIVMSSNASSKLSENGRRMQAIYGSVQKAEQDLSNAKQRVAKSIASIEASDMSKSQKKQAKNRLLDYISNAEKEVAAYVEEMKSLNKNERVLTVQEILKLPAKQRAKMLANKKEYSLEQRQELNKIPNYLAKKMIDAGRLQEDVDKARKIDADIKLNPSYFGDYHRRVKEEAMRKRIGSKYAYLNNPNLSYDEFVESYNKTADELSDPAEQDLLFDTIKNSPHFEKFSKEIKDFNDFITKVFEQKAYKDLDRGDRANVLTAINALYRNRIPITENSNIDDIINGLTNLPIPELSKFLEKQQSFDGEFALRDINHTSALIKTILDGINKDKQAIAERNKKPEVVDSSKVDNTPPTLVETTKEEEVVVEKDKEETIQEDSDEINSSSPAILSLYQQSQREDADLHNQATKDFFDKVFSEITTAQQEGENWNEDQQMDYIENRIATTKLNLKKALKRIAAHMKSLHSGDTSHMDTLPQDVELAPTDKNVQQYLIKHKQHNVLGTSAISNGTPIFFYTPEELITDDAPLPVVALIENNEGDITIKGKSYSVIGTAPLSESMKSENSERKGNFLYSQTGIVHSVQKDAYEGGLHTPTNLNDIVGKDKEISVRTFVDRLERDEGRVSAQGTEYTQYVYNMPRGRGKDTIPIAVFVADMSNVKNDQGQSLFDVLKSFMSTNFASTALKIQAAQQVQAFNYRTSKAISALVGGLNEDIASYIRKQLVEGNPIQQEVLDKKTGELYKEFNKYIRRSGAGLWQFKIEVSDIAGTTATANLSLVSTDGQQQLPLTSFEVSENRGAPLYAGIEALYNMAFTNGKVAKYTDPRTNRVRSELMYNIHYDEKPHINRVQNDLEAGHYEINHSSLSYDVGSITYTLTSHTKPDYSLVTKVNTDNAAPVKTADDTITATDGTKVDSTTGLAEEIQTEPREEKPAYSEEFDESILINLDEVEDDDDYQLVKDRNSKIKSIKTHLESLTRNSTAAQEYSEWTNEHKKDVEKDSAPNSFAMSKKESLKDAKKRAQERARELINSKDPRVKSVKVVQSSKVGYHIQVEYNTYERYLDREITKLNSLSTEALNTLYAKMQNKESVINPTQKAAEKTLTIFSRFKNGAITKTYRTLEGSPMNKHLDNLFTRVLKAYGFKVVETSLGKIHGKDILGKLDSLGKMVYLAKGGKRNKITSAEELSHVLVDFIQESNTPGVLKLKNALASAIDLVETTELYSQVKEDYSEVKDYNTRKEAVGKALATILVDRYDKESTFLNTLTQLVEDTIVFLRSLLEKSGLVEGTEATLQYQLIRIAKALADSKVKEVAKQAIVGDTINANKISTKERFEEIKSVQEKRQALKELMKSSSAVSIKHNLLSSQQKELLALRGITKEKWDTMPLGLQDNILRCITK